MTRSIKRRNFLTLLGGAAAAWPLAARAQQGRTRVIGGLLGFDLNDPLIQLQFAAFNDELVKLGWVDGRNVRIEFRHAANDPVQAKNYATELVSVRPDVIFVHTPANTRIVQQLTTTTPIVFIGIGDPIAAGVATNTARPEGNATGFTNFLTSFGGKWVELLKEAAPHITSVGIVFNPDTATGAYFASIEEAARVFSVTTMRIPYRNPAELESALDNFAAEPSGGLLATPPSPAGPHREAMLRSISKRRLPAIYAAKFQVQGGGLMSYGIDNIAQYRLAATYLDRILRGAKVSELPIQFPTKFELVVNLKAAKAIGLTIPEALLLRADELIE
jgi:ABC-type uncharacterized transport system substrate-binding protein